MYVNTSKIDIIARIEKKTMDFLRFSFIASKVGSSVCKPLLLHANMSSFLSFTLSQFRVECIISTANRFCLHVPIQCCDCRCVRSFYAYFYFVLFSCEWIESLKINKAKLLAGLVCIAIIDFNFVSPEFYFQIQRRGEQLNYCVHYVLFALSCLCFFRLLLLPFLVFFFLVQRQNRN